MSERFEIRDPIYGFIFFNELEKEIIDSPPFQRLRRIKQLGFSDYVYPGATHTRFEHSLGVMESASRIFDTVVNDPELSDNDKRKFKFPESLESDRKVLRLAALFHDIGHSPFSHSSEGLFPKEIINGDERELTHEDYIEPIINYTGLYKKLLPFFEAERFTLDDILWIAGGNLKKPPRRAFDHLLREIITGDLGADRIDYLIRDSLHLGVGYGMFDHIKLIESMRILERPVISGEVDNGSDPTFYPKEIKTKPEPALGIDYNGRYATESLMLARYFMFTQVYFHKTRRILDTHLASFLKTILEGGVFPKDPISYLEWDDVKVLNHLFEHQSKSNHYSRLLERRHLREAYEFTAEEEMDYGKLEDIEKALKDEFGENDIVVDTTQDKPPGKYNYGKPEFPVYNKNKRKIEPITDYSDILAVLKPVYIVRVYSKKGTEDQVKKFIKRREWE